MGDEKRDVQIGILFDSNGDKKLSNILYNELTKYPYDVRFNEPYSYIDPGFSSVMEYNNEQVTIFYF